MPGTARVFGFYALCLHMALLPALAAPAIAQAVRSPIPTNVTTASFDGFLFPQQIAGLSRNGRLDYQVPGAGFSVSYGKKGVVWADVYVYDRQLDLTSGSALSLARNEMESAIDEIHALVKRGQYLKAKIKDQSVSGPFAKTYLKITQGGAELDSFVFITVRKGKFVKIRLTSSLSETASNAVAEDFAASYSRLALMGEP